MALSATPRKPRASAAQIVTQQAGGDEGVVGLLLDHGAGGDDQGRAQLVLADAVVKILQGLVQDFGFADIGQPEAGLVDNGVQAVEVQRRAAAVCLYDSDIASGCLGGGGQGLLGGAFARLLFPVDHIIPRNFVFARTHQGQFHLVLYVLDMDSPAGGHAALECGHYQFGQFGHGFMDAAGRCCRAALHREKCLGDGHRYLAGLKGDYGAIALDDPQLSGSGGGDSAADGG